MAEANRYTLQTRGHVKSQQWFTLSRPLSVSISATSRNCRQEEACVASRRLRQEETETNSSTNPELRSRDEN